MSVGVCCFHGGVFFSFSNNDSAMKGGKKAAKRMEEKASRKTEDIERGRRKKEAEKEYALM